MSGDFFVDSNIWLYAFMDESSPKHTPARALIEQDRVVLSTQVINEVCSNLIRKADYTEPEIQQTIQNLAAIYPILDITLPIIRQASKLRVAYRLSYWDSLILATAQDAGCSVVYSEDMQDNLKIAALIIRNPFKT
ncbi:MAG: PIN domain-containing protein [Candidatus Contendobacter sp.]|jgi:predicted nucleic acid-binding protein|nr:PIN domain-containing protein [Gammaproteobacteria bacterium]MCC8992562.1 PIN domain-containing protein [Candidatus Contendobacter sp.]